MRVALSVCICLFAAVASAQTPPADALAKFKLAEKHYQAGRLLEAAPLYQQLVDDEKAPARDKCFDRLIDVTMRLGRCDQAIAAGDRYLALLKKTGDVKTSRIVDVQMAACWWALGHNGAAEKILGRAMSDSLADFPLQSQVGAWELLARCQAKRGEKAAAKKSWSQIEDLVSQRLRDRDDPPSDVERVQMSRKLAESLRGQERFQQAESVLKSLGPIHERMKDVAGQRDSLREMATLYREQMKLAEAETTLDEALKLHATLRQTASIAEADLEAERSEILQLRKKSKEAKVWRDKAIEHYQEAYKRPDAVAAQGTSAVLVFWKLQSLVQQSQQFRKALELTQTQAEQWAGGSLLASKLDTEQGSLQYLLGSTKAGRAKLRDAVDGLERQSPWNLIELPRAYVNLAAVEATTDDLDKAERLVQKTLDLYHTYALPDDAVVVEAFNLRGTIVAQRGDYTKAIGYFREGLERCKSDTLEGPLQRSNLMLNIALLHKSQGELPEAIKMCSTALEEFEKIADPDALGLAAFDAGLANMYLAQNQIAKAGERTKRLARLCEIHGVDRGPLVVTAKHVKAVDALSKRDLATAEECWRDLLKLQEREGQTLLMPRTLNYLGVAAELRKDLLGAEELYRRALKLQSGNQRSFAATQFITLWRLANVVKADRKELARDYLGQAITHVEKARLRTFGDAMQRATFFAQFGAAFEQSVDWMLQNRDVESAFQVLTRGRSRTLMDQLQMANLDPLETLEGPQAKVLRKREETLRIKLASLRAKASLVGVDALSPEETKTLLAEFDKAQADYAETWREIWNASPEYHALADPNLPEQVLPKLRERVLKNGTVMLAYHVGKESSHVLLLGDAKTPSQFFPLVIGEDLARNIAPPEPRDSNQTLAELRGVKLVPKTGAAVPPPVPLPPPMPDGKLVPLTQDVARALIELYRQDILDRDFTSTRGFVVKARDPNRPLPPQRPELTGQVFLPKALRDRLRELKPQSIVVVPDGALHTLPLETLVLEAGPRPKFAIDELPPMIYAPSGAILAVLADRKAPNRDRPSLLTVSNPSYVEVKGEIAAADSREGSGFLGFAGQLPRLPFTETESKQIRKYFAKDRVFSLSEADATERNVAQAVKGKSIVHVAAHGFADSRFGNLFGALALSPSKSVAGEDDGFLSLHEIYRLPLQDCDLAVLSACLTHVGPQQPMEAGVTLANGFLSAGARRVVASHWNVADRSTSQLMSYFFEALTREPKDGVRLTTAQAMQEARQRLRANAEHNWSAPFYWAPFVVLGSPE